MKLSVIIPVYNEQNTFRALFEKVQAVDVDKEIIVVDNCSTDGTRDILREISSQREESLRIVLQPQNYGKGTSVRTGIRMARGEFLIVQDADLEYDPQEYPKLLVAAEAGKHAVVYGSRLMALGMREHKSRLFYFGRTLLSDVFSLLYGQRITDVSTCYKLIRTDVAQSLNLRCCGFDLDFEISAKLARRGYRIHEVPISYRPRTAAEGKKLRLRDGWTALWTLVRCRFEKIS
ncbi:MAG: glycosyltransferase family 2 protein [Abditibacteriales bacterium]|nr:glycosyltransferase family 2 protein [Abditibacteriales bacterium]MDW8367001.1 glycosyltransferase family 2 protein [Abditibacteriales bacterium]